MEFLIIGTDGHGVFGGRVDQKYVGAGSVCSFVADGFFGLLVGFVGFGFVARNCNERKECGCKKYLFHSGKILINLSKIILKAARFVIKILKYGNDDGNFIIDDVSFLRSDSNFINGGADFISSCGKFKNSGANF